MIFHSKNRITHSSSGPAGLVTVLIMLLLVAAAGPLHASPGALSNDNGELPEYRRWHNKLRDAVYKQQDSTQSLKLYFLQAKEAIEAAPISGKEKHYWLSRTGYLMGRAEQYLEHKEQAAGYYEKALEHIDASLQSGEYSEGLRLKSEVISQMCLVKGVGFIIANGPKVNKLAEEALELDPRNGKAIIILASSKVYPPPIYGGNPKKGIELMREASGMPDIEKDDRFNIYSGIGIAYSKMKKPEKAAEWMERALEIYPENKYINDEYDKVK